ncbi:MAG: histidine phosphatase family protein [Anaerolineae bacterium]|nr:histidine phosphatase family protein [Anaerolineae bacterium]
MQLYYVRHGQSENNLLHAQTGSSEARNADPALTELGVRQAECVAAFLASARITNEECFDLQNVTGVGLTHLYTSLTLRAVMTGTIIARAVGLPLVGWTDIHETGGIYLENKETGELVGYPGKSRAYFAEHFPELILPDDMNDAGWWNRPFEDRPERLPRAQRVMARLLEKHGGTRDRVAMVSHGGFFNYLLMAFLHLDERRLWFYMNNAAVTRFDFDSDNMPLSVAYLNRAEFLPGELIT